MSLDFTPRRRTASQREPQNGASARWHGNPDSRSPSAWLHPTGTSSSNWTRTVCVIAHHASRILARARSR